MKLTIEKFINEIRYCSSDNSITILGDGTGDFEEESDSTTKECLIYYIDYCENQVNLAKSLLLDKEKIK